MFNSADDREQATLFPIGAGAGVVYKRPGLNLGLGGEYHYPMFEYQWTWFENTHKEKFSGHSVSPALGSSVKFSRGIWASALNYKWLGLSGRYDGQAMGDLTLDGYGAKTQLLLMPGTVPISFFGKYDYRRPIFTDEDGKKWFETIFTDYITGIGLGIIRGRLTAGLEGFYQYSQMEDKIAKEEVSRSDFIVKLGAEFGLRKDLYLRAGYNYNQQDPDLAEPDDRISFNTITTGLGINLIQNTRIDFAYNYRLGRTDSDPEERITDHIIFIYLRYNLKKMQ